MNDMQWLEALHRAHYATLVRLARNRLNRALGSAAEAEDVVQEAFILAVQKDIRTHEAPLGWLLKTVDHLCRRRIEKAARSQRQQQAICQDQAPAHLPAETAELPEDEAEAQALLTLMEDFLSAQDWELLRACCLEGKTPGDIAQARNLSVNAIRVRLHRIRKRLKILLQKLE